MVLLLVVVVAALGLGRLAGGRFSHLGDLRVRHGWLALAAVGADAAAAATSGAAARVLTVVTALLVVGFLTRNRRLPGLALVSLGLAANALVIVVNSGMPVSLYAAARAGVPVGGLAAGGDPRHLVATSQTRLPDLGDVVPVALPLRPEVASPGDLLVAAGIGLFVVCGMLGSGDRQSQRSG
ncbi:MAG: DUF5317 domain-containing protein [Mycobacteriales bacterium]